MEYDNATSWQRGSPYASLLLDPPFHQPASNTASTNAPAVSPSPPRKGTFFDEAIDLRDPEGDAITNEVLALISAVESRRRRRRQVDEENHYLIVRKVLANGFRCYFHWRPPYVAYYRQAANHRITTWPGEAMARTVDLLAKAGLLETARGEPSIFPGKGTASTYAVLPALCSLANRLRVTDDSITCRVAPERLVRMREGNRDDPEVLFQPTEDTCRWTALLEAYNDFLARQSIGLHLSLDEEIDWLRRLNRDRDDVILYRPELYRTDLYRQFNNGSFEQGGRMYGGWWITAPKELRRWIRIDGRSTIELDFSGCAIRMLYHERDIDYQDDPYLLKPVAAYEARKGVAPGHFREAIKAITQALINDQSGGTPERIQIPDGSSFRPKFKRSEIRQMIEEKHAPIAGAFGTGAGLRLQRKDSDLALDIITKLREQEVVALPIHDSFIVAKEETDRLINQMRSSYFDMFRFYPSIK